MILDEYLARGGVCVLEAWLHEETNEPHSRFAYFPYAFTNGNQSLPKGGVKARLKKKRVETLLVFGLLYEYLKKAGVNNN